MLIREKGILEEPDGGESESVLSHEAFRPASRLHPLNTSATTPGTHGRTCVSANMSVKLSARARCSSVSSSHTSSRALSAMNRSSTPVWDCMGARLIRNSYIPVILEDSDNTEITGILMLSCLTTLTQLLLTLRLVKNTNSPKLHVMSDWIYSVPSLPQQTTMKDERDNDTTE